MTRLISLCTVICLLIFNNIIIAQTPQLQLDWAKSNESASSADIGEAITTDASGNVFTVGTHTANIDLDPGAGIFFQSSAGQEDIFIQKLDANGNFVWGKSIGGSGEDIPTAIETDANGNIIITGYFENIVDFDPGVGNMNISAGTLVAAFVLKLNTNGDLVWVKTFGVTGRARSYSLALDNSGNIFISGHFDQTIDFDPGTGTDSITASFSDLFCGKIRQWGKLYLDQNNGRNAPAIPQTLS